MEPHSIFSIIIIALSIIFIAVLSSSESSFIAVNKIRIRSLMEKGDSRAKAVQKILDEHDKLFSAVILSGNLFTILATSIGTALALRYFGEDGIIIAIIVMTFLTVVFGELAPKTFAVTHSEKVSLLLARPVAFYIRLISPLVWIFKITSNLIIRMLGGKKKPVSPFVTEEEIKTMINIAIGGFRRINQQPVRRFASRKKIVMMPMRLSTLPPFGIRMLTMIIIAMVLL